MTVRRSVRIDLATSANGFKRIREDKPVYYNQKHNAILSTNGYIAEIISHQPYYSVVVGLPYILRDGVCKNVTYRKSSENLKNDIRIMRENLDKFSSNGFHQMTVTECFDTALIKLSSSYCPEVYVDVSSFNESMGKLVNNCGVSLKLMKTERLLLQKSRTVSHQDTKYLTTYLTCP
ncbi:hypothetical protein ACL6ER_09665 [Bacillus inaquosorum]|uniref:hypothetical protein n=1 Tax=Bacillus inaquosorum TaxID=483913 RepID=UPI0039A46DA2